jgi:phosphoribosylformylglycinamidine synthase subunit PurL
VKGIGDACRALEFPIVSGNVSLYNETNGRGILPTPTIGGVGLIDDWSKMVRVGFAAQDQMIVLVGAPGSWGTHLGQSVYMRDIHGRTDGPPPPVDLAHERRVGDHVRSLIRSGIVTAAHDVSDGGIAVALAEMAMASGIGATVPGLVDIDPVPVFFGEDQGRYILTLSIDPHGEEWNALLKQQSDLGIFAPWIGSTGGTALKLGDARAIPVSELTAAHEGWFPGFMDRMN